MVLIRLVSIMPIGPLTGWLRLKNQLLELEPSSTLNIPPSHHSPQNPLSHEKEPFYGGEAVDKQIE